MKKFLVVLLMIFTLTSSVFATSYNITNWTTLNNIRNGLNGNYVLQNDLTTAMSDYSTFNTGAGWNPIGNGSSAFTGTFDGQNNTLDGLFISRGGTNYIGLFGETDGATISNLGLTNINLTGLDYVGGLVGYNYESSIDNSYSTGNIHGRNTVGGLVGYNYIGSTIDNSYSTANVTGTGYDIGGLVGINYDHSIINNSYATGQVSGYIEVGGLVGYNYYFSTIDNSYATGNVYGTNIVGGLVGYNYDSSTIDNSYATGNVAGPGQTGGLVGNNYDHSTIDNSYWYNSSGNPSVCVGQDSGTTDCTAIDNEEYFYNYSNAPMNVWDFTNVWSNVLEFYNYPILNKTSSTISIIENPIVQKWVSVFWGTVAYLTRQGDFGIDGKLILNKGKLTNEMKIYNNGNDLILDASGGYVYAIGNISATGFNTRTQVNTKLDVLESFKSGDKLLNQDGNINHSAFDDCYVERILKDYDRPIEKNVCFFGLFCKERTTYPFTYTISEVDITCQQAKQTQALALLNKNINLYENLTDFDNGIIVENIYTQSKMPETGVDYFDKLKEGDKLKVKETHYSYVENIFGSELNGLSMEDRVVVLEGFANQIMFEMCDKDKNKWSWCDAKVKKV